MFPCITTLSKQGGINTNNTVKNITKQALIAACYVVLTLITYPISFLGIQFRIAEALVILCYFKKENIIGVTIGCILANLTSAIGFVDAGIGGAATLLSCFFIWLCPYLLIGLIFTVLTNGFLVGAELFWFLKEPFWLSTGMVILGEVCVLLVAYVAMLIVKRKRNLPAAYKPYGNIDFKW